MAACSDDTTHLTFTSIGVGTDHSCGITTTGATYCWGDNSTGELGNGDTTKTDASIPVQVLAPQAAASFLQMNVASFHTCALTSGGAAYCWGLNAYGDLGIGTTAGPRECSPGFSCSPTPLAVVGGLTFVQLSGWAPSCGLATSGDVYCWGLNSSGQLGSAVPVGVNSPTPVAILGAPVTISLAVRGNDGCGLTSAHMAYCWGHGRPPTDVAGGLTFSMLASGTNHTCGVINTGAAYCWGGNGRGEIGDGTSVDRPDPVPVVGGFTFVTLSGGWEHTCGVTSGGAAYCWGKNADGELGIGTAGNDSYTPIAVVGGLAFTAISAGRSHTCALTATGTVYCWGLNTSGQLGNGVMVSSPVPVQIIQ